VEILHFALLSQRVVRLKTLDNIDDIPPFHDLLPFMFCGLIAEVDRRKNHPHKARAGYESLLSQDIGDDWTPAIARP
jgi:hypothetical protein